MVRLILLIICQIVFSLLDLMQTYFIILMINHKRGSTTTFMDRALSSGFAQTQRSRPWHLLSRL